MEKFMAKNLIATNTLVNEPSWLKPNFQDIPLALQQLPWAVWKAEARLDHAGNPTGKWSKAPRNPKTGWNIPTNDPSKFGTFQEAQEAFATGQYTGVGVLLIGNGITGIDIDDAIDVFKTRPKVKDWVKAARNEKVYLELSPSGNGMRLFVYGRLNCNGRKQNSLEIYDDVRFLTITGHTLCKNTGIAYCNELTQGQHLIGSFLNFFPSETILSKSSPYSSGSSGKLDLKDIAESTKAKLPDIFNRAELVGDRYEKLFNGDTSMNMGDHSAADLALIGYFSKNGLTPQEADRVFRASDLYRPKWDELRGKQTYGDMTINKVFGTIHNEVSNDVLLNQPPPQFQFLNPENYKPLFAPNGMLPRKFVGPKICEGTRLFPERALSSLVALGAVGKTSLLLSIACHIAAGKDWNSYPLQQQKVAMFFCEETQEEISRKFSAITEGWDERDRNQAISNLITIPLLGVDGRLTSINRNQYSGSGITEKLITLLKEFNLKDGLVILDHMQGFAAGDLNLSETATAICREANKIVDATGAAVVMAAHISKNNIKATEIEQGFAVGSLAFENATRQMLGMISMPPEEAKKYGLETTRKDYVRLSLAKNSYGAADNGIWLRKVFSAKYHTVTFEPIILNKPMPAGKLSEIEKIGVHILDYITKHQYITRNKLDSISGVKGVLKASKAKTREALERLIVTEKVKVWKVDETIRNSLGLSKQVKEILRINNSMPANKPTKMTDMNLALADLNPLDDWD
jgi:RecA-family ATPase